MILDQKVRNHLDSTGLSNDAILVSTINAILNRPRHLDMAPNPIKLVSVKSKEACGIKKEFELLYNTNYDVENDERGVIDLNSIKIDLDYRVYVMMKSLIMLGINKNEARAMACRDIFMSVLQIPSHDVKVSDLYVDVLVPNGDYYHDTICIAISDILLNSVERADMFCRQNVTRGLQPETFYIRLCETFKVDGYVSLITLVQKMAERSKSDDTFKPYKRGLSKEEIGCDYLCYLLLDL